MPEPDEVKPRVLRPLRGATLLVAGALGGLVLWYAAFPSMYYLMWILAITGLWSLTVGAAVVKTLALGAWHLARGRRVTSRFDGAGLLLGWLLLVTVAVGLELPLRAHFALSRGHLETQLAQHRASERRDRHAGMFCIDEVTPGRCDRSRTLFFIENDIESAFVYAPGGIEGLCYNSGNTGHLEGDWYWMTED